MKRVLKELVPIILLWAAHFIELRDRRLTEAEWEFDQGRRLKEAGQYTQAVPFIQRALVSREAILGSAHPAVASSLALLGDVQRERGDYERAETLLQSALTKQEAALGKDHPDVAQSLNSLALLYQLQGLHARAEPLLVRALTIQEAALGGSHPDVAQSLNNLALLYYDQGLYERAEPLYERALAIGEAVLGKYHPGSAQSLNNLAALYQSKGLFARAEPLLVRALAIWEENLGPHHPNVARALTNLGNLHLALGLYERAEPLYARALAIRETALGQHHPEVATALTHLANLYLLQGLYTRAEPLYERALTIRRATLGEDHFRVAQSLFSLGALYMAQGLYGRAEPLYERALAIQETALGGDHPEVALTLNSLGALYMAQGLYGRAEPLYERALAIQEASLGKGHTSVATSLTQLALLRLAQEHLGQAVALFERALAVSEENLRREVYGLSEARLASVLSKLRTDEERLYRLVRSHPGSAAVRKLALTAALLRKGRSVEEVSNTSRIIYRSLGQEERAKFERLRTLRTQLSILSLAGVERSSDAASSQRLKELAQQADYLETYLARRSASLRALRSLPPPSELAGRVAAALPKDGALVEFVAYDDVPLVPTPGTAAPQAPSQLRYLALVLFANGWTHAVDLGPAGPIDAAVQRLQDALARNAASYVPEAQALYQRIFRPLVPLLGKVQRLFLSPDGQLSLVPFAALHDGRRFLLDGWDITYLTSGKELLSLPAELPSAKAVVVLADPDFSFPPVAPRTAAQTDPAPAERSDALERFFSSLREDVADRPYPPLPGTRKEAEAIQRMFPEAQLLLGRAATKDALLKLTTPGILHIATHGFFLKDEASPATSRWVATFGAVGETGPVQRPPDPLLRSGLVLAGADATAAPSGSHSEETLVTALELAGLDLWGTQLVVLSACDTGRGEVKLGQGVYGLRRALMVAGAETLVTSLWKVNDESTQELMEAYYRHLLLGQGRTTALRQAMLELRQKRLHPHFWAPFIAIGRDSPLSWLVPRGPGVRRSQAR